MYLNVSLSGLITTVMEEKADVSAIDCYLSSRCGFGLEGFLHPLGAHDMLRYLMVALLGPFI